MQELSEFYRLQICGENTWKWNKMKTYEHMSLRVHYAT